QQTTQSDDILLAICGGLARDAARAEQGLQVAAHENPSGAQPAMAGALIVESLKSIRDLDQQEHRLQESRPRRSSRSANGVAAAGSVTMYRPSGPEPTACRFKTEGWRTMTPGAGSAGAAGPGSSQARIGRSSDFCRPLRTAQHEDWCTALVNSTSESSDSASCPCPRQSA